MMLRYFRSTDVKSEETYHYLLISQSTVYYQLGFEFQGKSLVDLQACISDLQDLARNTFTRLVERYIWKLRQKVVKPSKLYMFMKSDRMPYLCG